MKKYRHITVRPFKEQDIETITAIWNGCFGQKLDAEQARKFFSVQVYCGAAQYKDEVSGVYILRPGSSGTAASAVYAVAEGVRGKGIGHVMAEHSMFIAKQKGFESLEAQRVSASDRAARAMFGKLGFESRDEDSGDGVFFCRAL